MTEYFNILRFNSIYFPSAYQIQTRHSTLESLFGAKQEEEVSLHRARSLATSATVCMVLLCGLEVAAYLLYNRKVNCPVCVLSSVR